MSDVKAMTIPQAFDRLAERLGAKTALIYLGTKFSYAKLKDLSDRFAAGLAGRGIEPGDRVLLFLPNSADFVVAWLGVLKAGATVVPITPIYTAADVAYIASDTGAKGIVCTDRNYGHVVQAAPETDLEVIVATTMTDLLPAWKRFFGWAADVVPTGRIGEEQGTITLPKLLAEGGPAPARPEDPDSIAQILYTGGTTRHPKGVPMTHRLIGACCQEQLTIPASLFPPQDNVLLGSAPMFHILGQTCGLGTLFTYGGTIVVLPRMNLDALLDAAGRYKATTLIGVPALMRMILEHDRLDQYDLGSVQFTFCGGDALPEDVAIRWKEKFGRPIYIGYGATETVGGTTMCRPEEVNPSGTMGRALDSKEIMIVTPGIEEPVRVGETGELLVHSDPMVTAYWNKPDETARSFTDIDGKLWYRTGDIVRADDQGFLYFRDRTVDTIKHKGYRVSASEVESVLQDHPAVTAACVIGLPDEKVGERIKAFVVLKKDVKGVTGYDLIIHCRNYLAAYKTPQYIEFRDMLPKSKVGKLLRREIRSEEASRQEG